VQTVRTSERRCFKRCRKRWEYEYIEGLQLVARSPKLWVGIAVHLALAAYHQDHFPGHVLAQHFKDEQKRLNYNKMDETDREALLEDQELADGMIEHYAKWDTEHRDFKVHAVEMYAEVPLTKEITLTMRADGLVEDDQGFWVLEHKTTTGIDADSVWLEIDDQASTYSWIFRQLNSGIGKVLSPSGELVPANKSTLVIPHIEGMLYNFLLKQAPVEVTLNKDNSVSRGSMNLKCTVEDYEEALRDAPPRGAPPVKDMDVYDDFLTKLRTKKWFHRLRVYRARAEMEGFLELLTAEIAEMQRARKNPLIRYRNPNRDCNWDCSYFDICKGELEGLDMEVTREEKFIVEKQLSLPGVP